MKAFIVATVILFIGIANADFELASSGSEGTCAVWDLTCVSATRKCTADWWTSKDKCRDKDALCCQYPLHCISGTCAEDNVKSNCTKDGDCVMNFYGTGLHACVNNRCEIQGNVMDSCLNNTQCFGGMKCVKGKCEGLSFNATCIPPRRGMWGNTGFSCGAGLVCSNATRRCETAAKVGEPCGSGCGAGLVCNKGTCVAVYSLPVGTDCDAPTACAETAACESGKCVAGDVYKTISCKGDDQCGEGTNKKCDVCSHVTGQRYCGATSKTIDCRAEWKKAIACWTAKSCSPVPSSSLDTCGQDACPAETNAILSCKSNCWALRKEYDVCASSGLLRNCPIIPTWARILIAFGILIAIVTIVFVIYTVARKIKTKDYVSLNESK